MSKNLSFTTVIFWVFLVIAASNVGIDLAVWIGRHYWNPTEARLDIGLLIALFVGRDYGRERVCP